MAAHLAPHHSAHKLLRLVLAAVAGLTAGAITTVTLRASVPTAFLLGVVVFALLFVLPYLWVMMRATSSQTADLVEGLSPGRTVSDLVILAGAAAGLFGVGWMLTSGRGGTSGTAFEGALTLGAVGSGWLLIHTMYAMRYARHWFNAEPGCVDFNTQAPPAYSDFLYLAFAVGMSFAISDTNLKTTAVRRIAIHHSLLSYLFGTVIVAATINLIAGLAP